MQIRDKLYHCFEVHGIEIFEEHSNNDCGLVFIHSSVIAITKLYKQGVLGSQPTVTCSASRSSRINVDMAYFPNSNALNVLS